MIAKAEMQDNFVHQIKNEQSCQMIDSLIRWSEMISLSSSENWTDWKLVNVISKQINNLLCIIISISSSICSSKKSEKTSTVINTESFITSRF